MTDRAIGNRLAVAQARAEQARARLSGTIGALQERAKPTSLVHDVTATLKERGTGIALGLMDTARRKPARTGAVLALMGLFLARHRVAGLVLRRTAGDAPRKSPSTPSKGDTKR